MLRFAHGQIDDVFLVLHAEAVFTSAFRYSPIRGRCQNW